VVAVRHSLSVVLLSALCTTLLPAQEVRVNASVDSTSHLIGDWIHVLVSAETAPHFQALGPAPGDTLGPFEVLRIRVQDSSESGGRKLHSWVVRLTTFDTGAISIPPLALHFLNTADSSIQTAFTDPIPLSIKTVDLGEDPHLKDIKPPLDAPLRFEDIVPYLLFLALLGLAAGGYLLYRRFRKNRDQEPAPAAAAIPAHERALMALKELEAKRLWQQGRVKEYYSELSEIVRRFFEDRLGVPALEMTSDEIVHSLKAVPETERLLKEIDRFLLTSDLVKFAKYEPSMAENEGEMQMAYEIVRSMIPRPMAAEESHAVAR